MFILDADICSYILRERPLTVLEHFRKIDRSKIGISVITQAELFYEAEKSRSKRVTRKDVDDFLMRLNVHSWDSNAAAAYGHLRTVLEKSGQPIGNMDMMIAAHALALKATVVTNNVKHFSIVPGLKVENWTLPLRN